MLKALKRFFSFRKDVVTLSGGNFIRLNNHDQQINTIVSVLEKHDEAIKNNAANIESLIKKINSINGRWN